MLVVQKKVGKRKTNFGISQVIESLLISCVGLLQIFHHQVAMPCPSDQRCPWPSQIRLRTKASPGFTVVAIKPEYSLEKVDSFREIFLGSENTRYRVHRCDGLAVVCQGSFIGVQGTVQVAHQLRRTPCTGSVKNSLQLMRCRGIRLPMPSHTASFRDAR